jgi:hypothetical protein
MGLISPILRGATDGGLIFWCPGCNEGHQVKVGQGAGPRWGYNGNPQQPTFTPSILIRSGHHVPGHEGDVCWCNWEDKDEFPDLKCVVCHSYVTNGQIQFLGDCTHELAGQTVPIPPWPNGEET